MKDNQTFNINIANDNQGNLSVGRDLNVKITKEEYKPEFFTPAFDDYEDDAYIIPIKAPQLFELVLHEKFLVLSGDGYDKHMLARYLAWKLCQKNNMGETTYEVQEWSNTNSPQNFEPYLQKNQKPTIFVFPNISPQNVGYNLSKLYRNTRKSDQYLIITTDHPLEEWKAETDVINLYWQPNSVEALFQSLDLVKILIKELKKASFQLPEGLHIDDFGPDSFLIEKVTVRTIAESLKTSTSIESFVKILSSTKTKVNESDVIKIIHDCQNDKLALNQWFYGFLSPREKIIALGLCLFDGLYDDQFFAVMEKVFHQSWRQRNPQLESLDYCDLDSLSHYYKLIQLDRQEDICQVQSLRQNFRQQLIDVTWNSHRRYILAALPVLENLIKESVLPGRGNSELCGTHKRQRQLRDVTSDILCHIGLKSELSIEGTLLENTLLRLSAEKDINVQVVAAQAMAKWREYNQDDRLFNTLKRWQDNSIPKILLDYLDSTTTTEKKHPQIYIKATVALTVGYAAFFDPPNQLNQKLCDLLEQLAIDSADNFIFHRFSSYTLPWVVTLHVVQLKDILMNMLQHTWLNESIGFSLAMAYQQNPMEVIEILNSWFNLCQINSKQLTPDDTISHRDAILATIAYTYGHLQFDQNFGPITFEDGFRQLQTMLQKETNIYVRKAVISAVIQQLSNNFAEVEKYLEKLLPKTNKDDQQQIVEELVKIHLLQRGEMKNGDGYFLWEENYYNFWLHDQAPLTDVEKMMRGWLKESNTTIFKIIAFQFLNSSPLVSFWREEEKCISEKKRTLQETLAQQAKLAEANRFASLRNSSNDNTVSIRIASWVATLSENKYLMTIRELLPEAITRQIVNRDALNFVFTKLKKDTDNHIKRIAEMLHRALSLVNSTAIFVIVFIVIIVLLVRHLLT